MSHTDLVISASAEAHVWAGVNPWVVGGVFLAFFLIAVAILVAFGNGREHS